jgi:hypothetical protein
MKPTLGVHNQCDSISVGMAASQIFPKTDFNYQASTLADVDGRCGGCCRSSFRAISQDYFAHEGPQHFAYEAVLFFILIMTVTFPLLNASAAVLELLRI